MKKGRRGSGSDEGPVCLFTGDGTLVDVVYHGMSLADWVTGGRLISDCGSSPTISLTMLLGRVDMVTADQVDAERLVINALTAQSAFKEAVRRLISAPAADPDVLRQLRLGAIDMTAELGIALIPPSMETVTDWRCAECGALVVPGGPNVAAELHDRIVPGALTGTERCPGTFKQVVPVQEETDESQCGGC